MDAYDIMAYNANSPYWVGSIQTSNSNNHRQTILIPTHPVIDSAYPSERPRRQLPMDRHRRCCSVYSDDDVYISNPTIQKQPTRDRRISAPHMATCTSIHQQSPLHDTTIVHNNEKQQQQQQQQQRVVRKPLPLVIPNKCGSRPQQSFPHLPPPPVASNRLPMPHSPQQRLLLRSPLSDRHNHPSAALSPSSSTPINRSSGSHGRPPSPNISVMAKQPTFWNPRPEENTNDGASTINNSTNHGAVHLRRNLSRRLKGLLQPQRSKSDGGAAVREKHKALRIWSVERPLTPLHNNSSTSDRPNNNPYLVLTNTLPVADQLWDEDDLDFQQIDTYAANVKQRGPMLTPALLAQKFLARPYRRELFKLRSIFIWIMQNIGPAAARDDKEDAHFPLADQVLMTRECRSPIEIACLFCAMARAIGHDEAHVVYGYLRGQKDTIDSLRQPNHAWVALQVEGEYRFVDCWLGSPYYPDNNDKVETHWFLCQPTDMILTHLPSDSTHQYLEPPVSSTIFFALPYVTMPYFWHHVQVLDFDPSCLDLVDDALCHLTLALDSDVGCYAQVETQAIADKTTTATVMKTRGLAQCTLSPTTGERICKVKAALPPNQTLGWLKIYCGPRIDTGSQKKVGSNHYPLALCFRLTRRSEEHRGSSVAVPVTTQSATTASMAAAAPFEFVQLHVSPFDLYVQEPQCFYLYPMQQYIFRVKSDHTHHKLAVRSPTGRMYKLMYYPHDHTYDGTVTINDAGPWSLVCLLHHSGGFNVIASWECKN